MITVVREGASIIGLFVMMFYYSWQLSLIPDRTGADCVGGDPRGLQAFSQYQ
ncbi:hypothetical protein LN650_21560 [Klebsiella pneumoniae subsp. pneumoniae]|nr:hypothetical protein [Klebsiella pneumoniae subsp. pneumoniae]